MLFISTIYLTLLEFLLQKVEVFGNCFTLYFISKDVLYQSIFLYKTLVLIIRKVQKRRTDFDIQILM